MPPPPSKLLLTIQLCPPSNLVFNNTLAHNFMWKGVQIYWHPCSGRWRLTWYMQLWLWDILVIWHRGMLVCNNSHSPTKGTLCCPIWQNNMEFSYLSEAFANTLKHLLCERRGANIWDIRYALVVQHARWNASIDGINWTMHLEF